MITICLLGKELDYEIPHKLNQAEIKNNILTEIKSEEERLRKHDLIQQEKSEEERKRLALAQKSYENFYNISTSCKKQINNNKK